MEQEVDVSRKFCEQCGAAARVEARFCGSCGFDISAAPQTMHPGEQEMAADQGMEATGDAAPMGLGMAWLIYLGAMVVWLGVMLLPSKHITGALALIIHFGFGFVMTRYVMGRLIEFHPVHNTIDNVFGAKLWMFLLWPLRMPVLLFKLTVSNSL
ncbi:hypothetical protein ACEN8I_05300 [Polaromonas sp. CT11-55]|uniref:hypothetical protein n=1 Tax=Polaromonas sp. CT11-55 TaxID=3243045 RepID=UPI0039A4A1BD